MITFLFLLVNVTWTQNSRVAIVSTLLCHELLSTISNCFIGNVTWTANVLQQWAPSTVPWARHQSLLLKIVDIASKSSMTFPTFWEVSSKLHHASITLGRKLRLREKKTQEKFDSTIKSKIGIWPAPILLAHSAELSVTWPSYIDSGNTSTRTTQPNGMQINREIKPCLIETFWYACLRDTLKGSLRPLNFSL